MTTIYISQTDVDDGCIGKWELLNAALDGGEVLDVRLSLGGLGGFDSASECQSDT